MGIDDFLMGVGFVALAEGLVLALLPKRLDALLAAMTRIPVETRRIAGLGVVAIGVALIWLVRGG